MSQQEGPRSLRVGYESARLELSRLRVEGDNARAHAARSATAISAHALGVERVGIWLFETDRRALTCIEQYTSSRDLHSTGPTLQATEYPTYVAGLSERRVIAVEDARENPLTRELAATYLVPLGITSMLDAPIIRNGTVVGVVCHEQVGPMRAWQQKEVDFAGSVGDIVTIVFEQADRLALQAAAHEQAEKRSAWRKMDALERLSRVVAHDLNNLLAAATLSAQSLQRHADHDVCEAAKDISELVRHGSHLARQLRDFAVHEYQAPERVDLAGTLEHLRPVLRSLVGSRAALEIVVRDRSPFVLSSPAEMEQLILNLSVNARDAVREGGHITITLGASSPADADVPPDSVVLEVRDDGVGMDEATREQLFEPYFTTKETGTGLGLAAVHGIVARSHGIVRVDSAPNQGTGVLVAFPRAKAG